MYRELGRIPSALLLLAFLVMGLLIPVIPSSSVTASNGPRLHVKEESKSYVLHYSTIASQTDMATLYDKPLHSIQEEEAKLAMPQRTVKSVLPSFLPSSTSSTSSASSNHKASHYPGGKRKIMKTNSIGFEKIISPVVVFSLEPSVSTLVKNTSSRLSRRSHRHVGSSLMTDHSSSSSSSTSGSRIHILPRPLSLTQLQPLLSGNSSVLVDASVGQEGEEEEEAIDVWRSYAASFPPGVTCRHREDLPPVAFQLNTCAWCYAYIPDIITLFGKPTKKLKLGRIPWKDPTTGQGYVVYGILHNGSVVLANITDYGSPVYSTFANQDARKKWTDCCRAAERCCQRIYKLPQALPEATDLPAEPSCPATWDGWVCWPSTAPGITVQNSCPTYIYFRSDPPSCLASVPKICDETGHWQRKEINGQLVEWTNFGTCASSAVLVQKKRAHVHVIAYAVSIIALIPAIILFFVYKQLRVHRIIIHQNFFLSLLINSVLVIAFKSFVILNDLSSGDRNSSLMSRNGIGCRLLFILTKYSRLTNYMWMFCEGYYLHKLIAAAFAEQKSLLVFYIIGWVFPLLPTVTYAVIRIFVANDQCWVIPQEAYEWVLNLPSLLSLLINFGFLINIIRVLVTKLRATHTMEQNHSQYRKAVRATLVLLPLFGTHFVVTIYRPPSIPGSCKWIELYYYVDYILDGLQGFLVALIFCYVNGEVVSLVKRSYSRWKEQRSAGCQRQQSRLNVRSNGRGRSVVSTHYSSVPASPEPGSLTRLTISHNNEINRADPVTMEPGQYSSTAGGGTATAASLAAEGRKFWLTNGKPIHRGHRENSTSSADEDTEVAWTDIKLGSHLEQKDDFLELRQIPKTNTIGSNDKHQTDSVKMTTSTPTSALAPASVVLTVSSSTTVPAITTGKKNGIMAEHQL